MAGVSTGLCLYIMSHYLATEPHRYLVKFSQLFKVTIKTGFLIKISFCFQVDLTDLSLRATSEWSFYCWPCSAALPWQRYFLRNALTMEVNHLISNIGEAGSRFEVEANLKPLVYKSNQSSILISQIHVHTNVVFYPGSMLLEYHHAHMKPKF